MRSNGYGHVLCSALQVSACWQKLESVKEEKEVGNDIEEDEVQLREKTMFEVEQTPLFCTGAPGHYQLKPWGKWMKYKSVTEQAVHIWRKWPSFLEVIENVDYDAPGDMSTTKPGWTGLMCNIAKLQRKDACKTFREVTVAFSFDASEAEEHCVDVRSCAKDYKTRKYREGYLN